WPDVDRSVETMRADVICAQQWLSKHATVTPSGWLFVGPDSDAPDPALPGELGDKPSMTGWLCFMGPRNFESGYYCSTSETSKRHLPPISFATVENWPLLSLTHNLLS